MHFTTRSFFGHSDPNSWSQFWENEPDDPILTASRGHLFGLINLSLTEDEDASAVGHNFINELNTQYFSASDLPLKNWLTQSVENISAKYFSQCSQLTLLIAVVFNQRLYLVSYNSGQIVFQRDSQISTILKSSSSQTSTVAGQSQDGDQLLLCTYPFSQGYSWDTIKNYLSLGKIQDIEENFLSKLYTLPDQSHLAAALIQFHSPAGPVDIKIEPSEEIAPPLPPSPTPQISLIKKLFASRPAYVPHLEPANLSRRRRFNIIFSLVVLFALGISIFYSSQRNLKSQTESKYQSLHAQFDSKIQAANAVKNINLADAQKLAFEADDLLKKMSLLKIHEDEISQLQNSTQTLLSQTGSSAAYQPVKFFDTTLISSDAKFTQMFLLKNNLYLLDNSHGRIDKIDLVNKSKQTVSADDNLKNIQSFAVDNDIVYILKDQQIYQLESKNFISRIKLPTSGPINFWNGSLYLLTDTIWKFTPNSSGFDSGAVWLKKGESLPSNPVSLAINGQIWVVSLTGTIVPYTHGAKTNFKMDTSASFTKVANLVTGADSNIIAFTDVDNLVYVYKKSGEFLYKYNFGDKKILSLAFSQTANTIFVLCADAQIYKIALQPI